MLFDTGVALNMHITHVRNMRNMVKKNIYNKVALTQNILPLYHRGCS